MWFVLVFLCAIRTANPLIERRHLRHLNDDLPELDVDSVLNSPEDVESLVDFDDSDVSIFDESDGDTEVGDDAPDDDDDGFDFDEDPDQILGTDKLLEDEEKQVKDSVGQPLEVLRKFGHGKYDGPNRPGKLHDGERPRGDVEKGEPKDSSDDDDDDDEANDDDLPPTKDVKPSMIIPPVVTKAFQKFSKPDIRKPIIVPPHTGPAPKEVLQKESDDEEGRGEPKTKDGPIKKIEQSSDSDDGAATMVKLQSRHSTVIDPKVAEVVHQGSTQDSNHKTYKILKPLKIPYSQLPEHIRPPNWMKGYHLVPREKPTENPDYKKLNFETPVTTHPATPDRVIDVDARNPAFYTRPPTKAPPPRPVVHTVLHTYKVEPSDTLREMLENPPKLPELPTTTTAKPRGILPKKFLKYLRSMAKDRREEFKGALAKSNEKSRKLFISLVDKIISVSDQQKSENVKASSDLKDTLEKLEDNMDKRFQEFKNEQKAKYAGKLSKSRSKLKKMTAKQEAFQKQFRDAVVDVKQEVSDDISRARKAHEQESSAGRLERQHLRQQIKKLNTEQKKMKKDNSKVVEDEKALLKKLNKMRKKKGKNPLTEAQPPKVKSLELHLVNRNGPAPRYGCGSCKTSQCRSACSRCNNCKTNRCRNVCKCGRSYRNNLKRLRREINKMKRTWNSKHRTQQKRLIRILRDKLKRFRMKFQKSLLAGKKKKPKKKKKKGGKFKTLLFGSWAKRSHRRLYRILEKRGIRSKTKRKVVRIFHKYYHRAMKEAAEWQDSDKHLSKYLTTVTKIWMKKVEWTLRRARKKRMKKKKKKKKKRVKKKKPKKKKVNKPEYKPVKIPQQKPLPPRPPPRPERSNAEKPYAERVYSAWRARSEKFIDVHYDSIPTENRAEVMGYVNRIFALVRKKYIDYLSRDYAPGTRYSRRKRFLDWLVKVSAAVHEYVMKSILGKKFSTGIKQGYLDRIWMKWVKKSKQFVMKQMKKIHCKDKARDYIGDIFKDAKQAKRNHEAMGSKKSTKMKFLKYLVITSKGLRAKVAFFQKTCKPVKGPRPYVTKMYKRWKRLSSEFVRKNSRRMCKERYRKSIQKFWRKQKKDANKKYLRFLKKEVKEMDASESSISEESSSEEYSDEDAVGASIEDQLGVVDNWFIQHLKRETRALESYVRDNLRKCGFRIIPRDGAKKKIEKIRAKYKKKMEKLDRGKAPSETMIARDKTYGITLGFGNRDNANNVGIGVENMKKDGNGNYLPTNWDFNKDADFKRSSYDVGLSFDKK